MWILKGYRKYTTGTVFWLLIIFVIFSGIVKINTLLIDWGLPNGIDYVLTYCLVLLMFGLLYIIFVGIQSIKFNYSKYPDIIMNIEYHFHLLDKIRNHPDRDDYDQELSEIESLIEDLIIYHSRHNSPSRLGFEAQDLLSRVHRKNKDFFYFINYT